jgi:hypothetical protein
MSTAVISAIPSGSPASTGTISPLAEDAYYGLVGEVVEAINPYSEADPAALIGNFLVLFGNRVGRSLQYTFGPASAHHVNEYLCVVGTSGEGRKSIALKNILGLWKKVEPEFSPCAGVSSGEGLIHAVRDAHTTPEGIEDPGVNDKRLMVCLDEFATAFNAMTREANNLAPLLRQAFDGDQTLQAMIKRYPQKATNPHISLAACITDAEIAALLDDRRHKTKNVDGTLNRILWVASKRSKFLASLSHDDRRAMDAGITAIVPKLKSTLDWAHGRDLDVTWSDDALPIWNDFYANCQPPGGYEGHIGRAEAHVCKLALTYALVDQSEVIDVAHLRAALAFYTYCRESALAIFFGQDILAKYQSGTLVSSSVRNSSSVRTGLDEERVIDYLRKHGRTGRSTVSKTIFGGNRSRAEIENVLISLTRKNIIVRLIDHATRPPTEWISLKKNELTNHTNCDELTNYSGMAVHVDGDDGQSRADTQHGLTVKADPSDERDGRSVVHPVVMYDKHRMEGLDDEYVKF